MKDTDKTFIKKLQEQIPNNISNIDEVASTLGISYDAAYRRLTGKVSITLDEAVSLSKKFDISLNSLFEVNEQNSYLIRESKPISNISDFKSYFERLHKELSPLVGRDDASILFGARELPMFYFFDDPLLIRFKIFIWFTILKVTPLNKRINFNDFVISDPMIEAAQKVKKAYNNVNVTEVWSFGSINNVLQQLLYLYKMKQINQSDAILIGNTLTKELKKIEEKTSMGSKQEKRNFELYSNELIMMNNSMIIRYKDKLSFGYPYALLRFFLINNQKACKAQETYIYEQMRHATCITNTSIKEHATFFNRKYDKIKQVLNVIDNEENKPLFL
jgi:plasmid maintenance system antidote protein VapI